MLLFQLHLSAANVFSLGLYKPVTTQSRLLTTLTKMPFENIMGKGENAGNQDFSSFLYARRRRDVLWDHPWRAGGRRPVLCPEHVSKTTLAKVMKFHGWIDLIQGECSAQES